MSEEGYTAGKRMQVLNGEYVPLSDDIVREWEEVAAAYGAASLPIYADESNRASLYAHAFRRCLHGINIKLEKAGGYRAALALLAEAKTAGVRTWLGRAVGSSLCSSQAAHLLPLATPDCWGDLDGLRYEGSQRPVQGRHDLGAEREGAIDMQKDAHGTACIRK